MARQARKPSVTGYYHVVIRGINKEFIYKDDIDKELYLELIREQQNEKRIDVAAWCLMINHVHLLIKADLEDLSKAIKIISIKYTNYYNKHHNRVGPLFGDRYKSKCIEDEKYLLATLRYIHKNPTQANLIENISDYKWSSYKEYLGDSNIVSKEQFGFIMSYFHSDEEVFAAFHQLEDSFNHLEIKEDKNKIMEEQCYRIIKDFCERNNIVNGKYLSNNKMLLGELGNQLVNGVGVSLRKAASLLETGHYVVDRAMKFYNGQ